MKRTVALLWLSLALMLLSSGAYALGLGNIQLHSALGQKLDADIALAGVNKESASSLKIALASAKQLERAGIKRADLLYTLSFKVVRGSHGYQIHVASSKPVNEPFLTFLVSAKWSNGEMLREYTLLLDPPNYGSGAGGVASAPALTQKKSQPARQQHVASSHKPSSAHASKTAPPSHHKTATATTSKPAQRSEKSKPEPLHKGQSASHSATPTRAVRPRQYGRISRGETLWGIANKLTSGNAVRTDQMMIAIYRANSDAFEGNINRLKTGQTLTIPTNDEVDAINPRAAIAAVQSANGRYNAQVAAAKKKRQARAQAAKDKAEEAANKQKPKAHTASNGNDNAVLSTKSGGHLQLVAPKKTDTSETSDETTPGANESEVASTDVSGINSELAAAKKQADEATAHNTQLSAKIALLQGKLDNAQNRLKVQDEKLSQLQQHAQQSQSESGSWVDKVENAIDIDRIKTFVKTPGFLVGLLIVLVLIVSFVTIRKHRSKPAGTNKPVEPIVNAAPTEPDDSGDAADDATADSDDDRPTEPAAGSDVAPADPIAEADFNIDYGLYDQAADVLRQAIIESPEQGELKSKLFQTYFAAGDESGFRTAAQEFASTWGAEHPKEWEKVSEMGRQIAPDEPLFAVAAGAATGTARAQAKPANNANESGVEETWELPDHEETPVVDLGETDLPTEVATEFGLETVTGATGDEPSPATSSDPREEALDFDIDLSVDESPDSHTEPSTDKIDADLAASTVEFEMPDIDADLAAPSSGPEDDDAGNPMLDTQTEFEDAIRELSEFVDTNLPDNSASTSHDDAPVVSSSTSVMGDDDADDLLSEDNDQDESDTKIELAQAYIDMGDSEGARSILQEVIEEGEDKHKKQAQSIIETLN